MTAKHARFSINPEDVGYGWSGSHTGHRTKATRQSRADAITGSRVRLTHIPTGVVVTGEVLRGHYSRREMRDLVTKLRQQLLLELEQAVARRLRMPGR